MHDCLRLNVCLKAITGHEAEREWEESDSRAKEWRETVKQRRWKLVELLTAATYFAQIYFETISIIFEKRDLQIEMM